jgi:hypothetical protein
VKGKMMIHSWMKRRGFINMSKQHFDRWLDCFCRMKKDRWKGFWIVDCGLWIVDRRLKMRWSCDDNTMTIEGI